MRKIILSFILFLIGYCAWAQSDYLITNKSDTLKGDIRILTYDKIDRVQVSVEGKKETFTALQVLTVYKNNESYKPVKFENTVRLMKVLKSGYLSMYAYNLPNQSSYDGRYLAKLDGSYLDMPNISFKKILSNYLEDCADVSAKIKKGELGKNDMDSIIDEYNICVTKLKPKQPETTTSEESEAIQNLSNKIKELNFDSKEDAMDILKDMQSKVEKKEKVSKYLIEGLQSALKDQSTVAEDLDKLIALLKK